jgi:lysozyme family protein
LQATLNDYPAQELKVGPKLREDGVIGPKTTMALNQTLNGTGVPDFMQRFRENLGFS